MLQRQTLTRIAHHTSSAGTSARRQDLPAALSRRQHKPAQGACERQKRVPMQTQHGQAEASRPHVSSSANDSSATRPPGVILVAAYIWAAQAPVLGGGTRAVLTR